MSIHTLTWAEPTTSLRDWLRTEATITDLVGQRVYANGLPDDPILPSLVITRVGGGLELPLDVGLFQFDCWASTGTAAASLASALIRLLYSTPSGTPAGAHTYGGTAENPDVVWLPNAAGDTPRYVVTAQVVTKTPNSP